MDHSLERNCRRLVRTVSLLQIQQTGKSGVPLSVSGMAVEHSTCPLLLQWMWPLLYSTFTSEPVLIKKEYLCMVPLQWRVLLYALMHRLPLLLH